MEHWTTSDKNITIQEKFGINLARHADPDQSLESEAIGIQVRQTDTFVAELKDITTEHSAKLNYTPKLSMHDSKVDGRIVAEPHVIEQNHEQIILPLPVAGL